MKEKRGSKVLEILNSKLVIIVLVFGMFFLATIFAGDMIFESGDLNVEGQGRFKGWFTQGTGLALEAGVSGASGFVYSYNRTDSTYNPIYLRGSVVGIGHSSLTDLFVDADGDIGIGTISPDDKFHVNCSNSGTAARIVNKHSTSGAGLAVYGGDSSSENILALYDKDNTAKFYFDASGDADCYGGAGCWNEISSAQFKENVIALSEEEYVQRLNDLIDTDFYNFTMIDDPTEEIYTGIVTDYSPEYVTQDNRTKTSPTQLAVWALTALKAEHEKVLELEKRIEALESG